MSKNGKRRPREVLTVANHKGGVGKTTICSNLAGVLSERGYRVLLVDLDKQANLTDIYAPDYDQSTEPGITDVLYKLVSISDAIRESHIENVSIVPGKQDVHGVELKYVNQSESFWILADALEDLSGFDYVIIDTPHDLGLIAQMAFVASSAYLVPIEPDAFSFKGIHVLEAAADHVRKRMNKDLACRGYVLNKTVRNRAHMARMIEQFRERLGDQVLKTEIRTSSRFAEAVAAGLPITRYKGGKTEWADLVRRAVDEMKL